jgi:hypothetical protein
VEDTFKVTVNPVENLTASETGAGNTGAANALTDAELQGIVVEAIDRWTEILNPASSVQKQLSQVSFRIADLSGLTLGQASADTIVIDMNAAGYGWYVDATPADDLEFGLRLSDLELQATSTSPALGRMDLLTVVVHELGHVLGFEDLDPNAGSLMSGTLDASTRRLSDNIPESPKRVVMDSMPGGELASSLWGAKDSKASWLEDFLVNLVGKKDSPFDPADKIEISIPGANGGTKKKQ